MANLFAFWEKTQKELSEIPLAVEQKQYVAVKHIVWIKSSFKVYLPKQ